MSFPLSPTCPEDKCCEQIPCSCRANVDSCGIWWKCDGELPHKLRIVKVSQKSVNDQFFTPVEPPEVMYEIEITEENKEGVYDPNIVDANVLFEYELQTCCIEPSMYEECDWRRVAFGVVGRGTCSMCSVTNALLFGNHIAADLAALMDCNTNAFEVFVSVRRPMGTRCGLTRVVINGASQVLPTFNPST